MSDQETVIQETLPCGCAISVGVTPGTTYARCGHLWRFTYASQVDDDRHCVACERDQAVAYRDGLAAACGQPPDTPPLERLRPQFEQGHSHAKQLLDEFARRVDLAQDRTKVAEDTVADVVVKLAHSQRWVRDVCDGLGLDHQKATPNDVAKAVDAKAHETELVAGALDAQAAAETRMFNERRRADLAEARLRVATEVVAGLSQVLGADGQAVP
jgi:hypothetical protein